MHPSNSRFGNTVQSLVLLVLLCIAGAAQMAAAQNLKTIVDSGVVRVAMSGDQQPFNFTYGRSGKVVGIDVDLAKELARVMNVRLEIVSLPFDELTKALTDGRADMVISGMSITAPRSVDFSFIGPYMLSGKGVLATKQAAAQRSTPQALNSSDVTLVALQGSTSESLARRDLAEAKLVAVAGYDEAVKKLMAGEVDGMVADVPILAYTRNRYPDAELELLEPQLSVEPLGIVISREAPQLENLLRNYLAVFENTGLLLRLYDRWFGVGSGDLYRR
ncbi:MAG: transporter substrate-binding domain-containing protein [Congregibacter sp.]